MDTLFLLKSTLGVLYTSGRFYILREDSKGESGLSPLAHVRKDIVGYVLAELRRI